MSAAALPGGEPDVAGDASSVGGPEVASAASSVGGPAVASAGSSVGGPAVAGVDGPAVAGAASSVGGPAVARAASSVGGPEVASAGSSVGGPEVARSAIVARERGGFVAGLARRFPGTAAAIAPSLVRFDVRVTVIMSVAAIMLLVFKKYGGSGNFEAHLAPEALRGHPRMSVLGDYYWFLSCFFMLGVVPLIAARLVRSETGDRWNELGLGLGDVRFGLRWVAILYLVMLPVIFIASRSATFSSYYPLNSQMGTGAVEQLSGRTDDSSFWLWFIAYELLYAVYFIGWEFFFRGFLTLGLFGRSGFEAVLIANIPFVLMHAGKPFLEGLGSFIAGLALGLFALRARSFWYCWLLHALIAISMDLFAIERRLELMSSAQ